MNTLTFIWPFENVRETENMTNRNTEKKNTKPKANGRKIAEWKRRKNKMCVTSTMAFNVRFRRASILNKTKQQVCSDQLTSECNIRMTSHTDAWFFFIVVLISFCWRRCWFLFRFVLNYLCILFFLNNTFYNLNSNVKICEIVFVICK